jgi:hypothetical protein
MGLGLIHALREMSTRIFLGAKGGRKTRKTDSLTAISELIIYEMKEPRCLTTVPPSTVLYNLYFNPTCQQCTVLQSIV